MQRAGQCGSFLTAFLALGLLKATPGSFLAEAADAAPEAPFKVKVIPDVRVRMRDGVELGAKISRPDADGRFPAIVSYNPYRRLGEIKRAPSEREYTHPNHGSFDFAQRGYAVVDYDVRGTGNSAGSSPEMYADAERRDGYEMVEWVAAQPWCNGNVGMWGISYGGVVTWQVAAQHPPHLKAVIVRSGTEDVYGDWTYPGGVPRSVFIHGTYGPGMAASIFAPPDPDQTGAQWAEIWEERLQNNVPWSIGFLRHQRDDSYWSARSVRPDYDRIQCPVFVIEGWADWYQTAELRAFANLKVPKRALIGPWAHYWPENALPGPRIDGRPEYLKWFDHWLKGVDNGVEHEPPVTIFVKQYQPPAPMYLEEKGFWRHETDWPLARTERTPMYLSAEGRLGREADKRGDLDDGHACDAFTYNPAVGIMGGILAATWSMPLDQRLDEAYSLTYTTPPLPDDLEVTGDPAAILFVSSTADVAFFEVKLCDVAPDGTSKLVSSGGLNATHRASRSAPELLKPGAVYELKIDLRSMAYVFPAGHRIRVDVASADFQNAWPVSKAATNTIHRGESTPSRIILPIVGPQQPRLLDPVFTPSPNPLPDAESLKKPEHSVTLDLVNQTVAVSTGSTTRFTVSMKEPGSATMKGIGSVSISKPDQEIKVEAQCVTVSSTTTFRHLVEVEVTVNGKRHFDKSWTVVVPREGN